MSSPVTGITSEDEFGANEWLVDEMYERYLVDKNSVDQSWWPVLEQRRSGAPAASAPAPEAPAAEAAPAQAVPAAAETEPSPQNQADGGEAQIPEVMSQAKFTIDNNGTVEELYKKIDEVVNSIAVR